MEFYFHSVACHAFNGFQIKNNNNKKQQVNVETLFSFFFDNNTKFPSMKWKQNKKKSVVSFSFDKMLECNSFQQVTHLYYNNTKFPSSISRVESVFLFLV